MRKAKQKHEPLPTTGAEELFGYLSQTNPRTKNPFVSDLLKFEDVPESIRNPFATWLLNYMEYIALLVEGQDAVYERLRNTGKPLSDRLTGVLAQLDPKTGKSGFQKLAERRRAIGK